MSAILTRQSSLKSEMLLLNTLSPETPVAIIASGPSLTDDQINLVNEKRDTVKVLVINDNYLKIPDADYLYACDSKWWKWHEDKKELLDFPGQKWSQTSGWNEKDKIHFTEKHGINWIESSPRCGLSTNPNMIHQGQNSGYQAINLAYHFGTRKIILIGYDMQMTNGKAHWFGDHPDRVKSAYSSWLIMYTSLAEHAKKLGLEIINCTNQTALTCFPKMNLNDVI